MKKRILSLLLCLCMFILMQTVMASASATNVEVPEVNYYEDSGDVANLTVAFGWDTASATSRLTVMTKRLRSAGESGTNKSYGDFTDYGYYGRSFKNWDAVLSKSDTFGMLYYTDEQKINMGKTNTFSVNFDEGDIPLNMDQTYYLYLWTYYGGYYYPDNLLMVLQVKSGKFQFASATGRNSYGSFETLWELTDAPAAPTTPTTPAADDMKLDPLPPEDYTKQPDWYGSLTPAHTMSNARLVAEYEQIEKVIADRKARGIYMSDGPYSRELDLWSALSQRCDVVERYDRGVKNGSPAAWVVETYNELVAAYGDAEPLRNSSEYNS